MKTAKPTPVIIDSSKEFQFIEVNDTGADSGACCPHCGANGRYIYVWAEFGITHAAMAGCYAALTGKIKMNDVDSFIQRLSMKVAKNKSLNGWDKTVIRMQEYIQKNSGDEGKVNWANSKIFEAVRECKSFAFGKGR